MTLTKSPSSDGMTRIRWRIDAPKYKALDFCDQINEGLAQLEENGVSVDDAKIDVYEHDDEIVIEIHGRRPSTKSEKAAERRRRKADSLRNIEWHKAQIARLENKK